MNRQEKLLNIHELQVIFPIINHILFPLQSYKSQDNKTHAKYPGWTPQIGNVGNKQLSDLVNKFSNGEAVDNKPPINQNQSYSGYQTLNGGFYSELPKSRGLQIT